MLEEVANQKAKKEAALKSATQDSREMQKTDAEDMVWQRKIPKTWKQAEKKTMIAMTEVMTYHPGVKRQNPNQWYGALVDHNAKLDSNEVGEKFISKPTFNIWLTGKKTKRLDEDHFTVIESFVKKYGHCVDYDDDVVSSSNEDEEMLKAKK